MAYYICGEVHVDVAWRITPVVFHIKGERSENRYLCVCSFEYVIFALPLQDWAPGQLQ